MLKKIKKTMFSLNGVSLCIALIGSLSSIIALFIDINSTISIKWLLFYILLSLWCALILLKVIFDKEFGEDAHVEILSGDIKTILDMVSFEVNALTATCFALEGVNGKPDKIKLYLIKNPNFENWWLAPGGHADLKENMWPDAVAKEKCLIEAGIDVELIEIARSDACAFNGCQVRSAPHFNYLLDIPPTSRCAKSRHHQKHLDFSFVATVRSHSGKGTYESKAVILNIDSDSHQINSELNKQLQNSETYLSDKPIFPLDFPSRVEAALKVYAKHIGYKERNVND